MLKTMPWPDITYYMKIILIIRYYMAFIFNIVNIYLWSRGPDGKVSRDGFGPRQTPGLDSTLFCSNILSVLTWISQVRWSIWKALIANLMKTFCQIWARKLKHDRGFFNRCVSVKFRLILLNRSTFNNLHFLWFTEFLNSYR